MAPSDGIRHPLGLPPGSIRGLLALQIIISFWLLLLAPEERRVPVPLNLYLLLTLVIVFFVSHGKSIATKTDPQPSPLWLPGGTFRLIIFGGTAAVLIYVGVNYPERFDRFTPSADQFGQWKYLFGSLAGGFAIGYLLRLMPFRNSWGFQSFQAWLSIATMGFLFVETILQVFVSMSVSKSLDVVIWQAAVTAVTACYFGTRS